MYCSPNWIEKLYPNSELNKSFINQIWIDLRWRILKGILLKFKISLEIRTTDAQWCIFESKSKTFGLGQTIWADKFWGIWGIFGWFINTHFGTVSHLPMFSINQLLFLQKTKPSYPNSNYLSGIWIWATKN